MIIKRKLYSQVEEEERLYSVNETILEGYKENEFA